MSRHRPIIGPILAALLVALALPAQAVTVLRDADIEHGLSELAAPVLRAAGLSPSQVRVLLVDDPSLNAFVVDAQHIFLHSGLVLRLKTPGAVQAVIAHEAAHIANGHLSRRAGNMAAARTAAGFGLALAAATAAAGGGSAAGGIAIGSVSSAMRRFMVHSRAEEASADQSAVRAMTRAGIDPAGALEVYELFRGQEALSSSRQDPYAMTHPLSSERLRALRAYVQVNSKGQPDSNAARYWFSRTQGKLSAFQRAPSWTRKRLGDSASQDIVHIREAVMHFRSSDIPRAMQAIDRAIALRPKDPFLWDLKGEILLKGRQPGNAVKAYAQAARLAPRNAIIAGGLGRAQLASGDTASAVRTLEQARNADFRNTAILRDLAQAYAATGQTPMASVVTAERYALEGRLKDAEIHAKRAMGQLPPGNPGYRRAEDIEMAARRMK